MRLTSPPLTYAEFSKRLQPLLPIRCCWVAYSGGVDSTVLLHLSKQAASEFSFSVRALHVNHNLHGNASAWHSHCAKMCSDYSIPCETIELGRLEDGKSREQWAREARYRAFADFVGEGDLLLTGHHRDDQAETVLLQLLRGAGSRGLAAMPHCKPFSRGRLLRPLLDHSRLAILTYAKEHKLIWIEDDSNEQRVFDRNFLRHEIMPRIKQRWPNMSTVLQRSAAHQAEVVMLLNEVAHGDLLKNQKERGGNGLFLSHFSELSLWRQKQLLMYWLRENCFNVPSERKIAVIMQTMLTARADKNPVITWPGAMLYRYRGQVFVVPPLPRALPGTTTLSWKLTTELPLPLGSLRVTPESGRGIRRRDVGDQLEVMFRHGGERLTKEQGSFRKRLKNLLQEKGVPSCYRNFLPFITVRQEVVLIPGLWCASNYRARSGEASWLVEWHLPEAHQCALFGSATQSSRAC